MERNSSGALRAPGASAPAALAHKILMRFSRLRVSSCSRPGGSTSDTHVAARLLACSGAAAFAAPSLQQSDGAGDAAVSPTVTFHG